MARQFRFRAPVWQAEVDAFGELRTAALLRFLQETATRASTAAGFDPGYYARVGSLWLVRRTALTRLAPIRYGDELEATTWIADFRRVRSRRDYLVHAGERQVAHASTDWVFVDGATLRPRRIPPEMQAAFGDDGAPPLPRPPFPESVAPAHAARSHRRVELHDLDALQHVNNATYAQFVEQAAHDAVAAIGWPLAAQLAARGRLRAVAHDVEYLDGAVLDDDLDLVTWTTAVANEAVERRTLIARGDGTPVARASSRYAWVSAPSGEPRPLPDTLAAALRAHLAG